MGMRPRQERPKKIKAKGFTSMICIRNGGGKKIPSTKEKIRNTDEITGDEGACRADAGDNLAPNIAAAAARALGAPVSEFGATFPPNIAARALTGVEESLAAAVDDDDDDEDDEEDDDAVGVVEDFGTAAFVVVDEEDGAEILGFAAAAVLVPEPPRESSDLRFAFSRRSSETSD